MTALFMELLRFYTGALRKESAGLQQRYAARAAVSDDSRGMVHHFRISTASALKESDHVCLHYGFEQSLFQAPDWCSF
jgi:hypothetical protein